jgi:hypothetical protein
LKKSSPHLNKPDFLYTKIRDEYHVAKTQNTNAIHSTLTLHSLSRLEIRRSFPCDKLQKQEYAANKNIHAGNISHTYLRKMVKI